MDVLELVVSKLNKMNISYMVGGSFASSLYGFARTTQDADLIVDVRADQADGFAELFAQEFYVDRDMIQQALRRGASFNVIHLESSFKVDFFILQNRSYDRESFSRRGLRQVDPSSEIETYLQSPEDTVLVKLDWYRRGGGISENQWKDVIGILKAQADRLDWAYMNVWGAELRVGDLLERAREEAGMQTP